MILLLIEDIPIILVAIITGASSVLPTILLIKERAKNKTPLKKLNLIVELDKFNELKKSVESLFQITNADRFIVFIAHNGKERLRFATMIYEQHKLSNDAYLSFGGASKYIKFEFDEEYRKTLKKVELESVVKLDVLKMPKCDLKEIYDLEKVKYSNIYILKRILDYDKNGNDLLIYCSLSSHNETPYTNKDNILFKMFIDNFKNNIINKFIH